MKKGDVRLYQKGLHHVEGVLLAFLVILGVLDFLEVLPGDIDFAKKIVSWTILGYLMYKASLTRIFFNHKHTFVDILLILSYFLLIIKNVEEYIKSSIDSFFFLTTFGEYMLAHLHSIELTGFLLGIIILLALAWYSTLFISINTPSLMHVIHEEGDPPNKIGKMLVRFIVIFFVFIFFFIVVFNLVMEWLALAVDAFMVMIGIFFYLFWVVRHYKRFNAESLIFKIGDFGESFYGKFLSLFHYKQTLALGISGMLALHLLTDIVNFITPFVMNIRDPLYLKQLGPGHIALWPLFVEQSSRFPFIEMISLSFVYIFNIMTITFLLFFPSYIWYLLFRRQQVRVSINFLSLFFVSLFVFLIAPIFNLRKLPPGDRVGVDITTFQALNLYLPSFLMVVIASIIIFILLRFVIQYMKEYAVLVALITGMLFFAWYVYLFFSSLAGYYILGINFVFTNPFSFSYFISLILLLFFTINILFYIGGYFLFLHEAIKRKILKNIL